MPWVPDFFFRVMPRMKKPQPKKHVLKLKEYLLETVHDFFAWLKNLLPVVWYPHDRCVTLHPLVNCSLDISLDIRHI